MTPKEVIFVRFANAGAPRDVATLLADYIHTLQQRVAELENLSASSRALNDLTARVTQVELEVESHLNATAPAHMRKTEKRG